MAAGRGASEIRALVLSASEDVNGGTWSDGSQSPWSDGSRSRAPRSSRVRLLVAVLSAGSLLAVLGLAVAGQQRTTTPTRHADADIPLQGKWIADEHTGAMVKPLSFRMGVMYAQDKLCLGTDNNKWEGSAVSIYKCEEQDDSWIWETTRGSFHQKDGLCLAAHTGPEASCVGAASCRPIPQVHLGLCAPGLVSQMWDIIAAPVHNGAAKHWLRNRATGMCIRAKDAKQERSPLSMQECNYESMQWFWSYEPVVEEVNPGFVLSNGWHGKIQNSAGICIKAADPHKNGSHIIMESCDSQEPGMYWNYAGAPSSLVAHGGLCMDFNQNYTWNEVHLWQCYPKLNAQKVGYDPQTGLIVSWGARCLEAPKANHTGSRVVEAACSLNRTSQEWILRS